jgi:protoheme IX farnesyltransferase
MVGNLAAIVTTAAGVMMAWYAYKLYRTCDVKEARRLMFASFFYLPIVQLFYVIDKF